MRALHCLACLALPIAATLACGSIDDPNQKKPLAVLEGQLTQASVAQSTPSSAGNVRIAVVWVGIDNKGYKSTQDIPASAVFPSKFKLELTDPPPPGAMVSASSAKGSGGSGDGDSTPPSPPPNGGPQPAPAPAPSGGGGKVPAPMNAGLSPRDSTKNWPADFAVAVGGVVAYEDLNGNGKLDLVEDGASSYVDRILGANEKLLLVYTEGTNVPKDLIAPNGTKPSLGYNLVNIGAGCAQTATDKATTGEGEPLGTRDPGGAEPVPMPQGPSCDESAIGWLPMTTLYELPLTAEPRFATIMCKSKQGFFGGGDSDGISSAEVYYPGKPVTPGPGPSGKYPAKNDPNVYCQEGGKVYSYNQCTTISQGLCKGTITSCTSKLYGYPTGATTAPADWPCTVK